ncbi:hypothetical protein AB5I41_28950 [Sphingomonas sp. MMS24-JH45]
MWLIDHGYSFTGPHWTAAVLNAGGTYRNRLKEWLTPFLTGERRSEALSVASQTPAQIDPADLPRIGLANEVQAFLGPDFDPVITFLQERAAHVPGQSTAALDMPT